MQPSVVLLIVAASILYGAFNALGVRIARDFFRWGSVGMAWMTILIWFVLAPLIIASAVLGVMGH